MLRKIVNAEAQQLSKDLNFIGRKRLENLYRYGEFIKELVKGYKENVKYDDTNEVIEDLQGSLQCLSELALESYYYRCLAQMLPKLSNPDDYLHLHVDTGYIICLTDIDPLSSFSNQLQSISDHQNCFSMLIMRTINDIIRSVIRMYDHHHGNLCTMIVRYGKKNQFIRIPFISEEIAPVPTDDAFPLANNRNLHRIMPPYIAKSLQNSDERDLSVYDSSATTIKSLIAEIRYYGSINLELREITATD